MVYYLAPSLDMLRSEVNTLFPGRDKTSDGWIGDPSHAARPSDHNPNWDATGRRRGIVHALDLDVDDNDPRRDMRKIVLEAVIGDPRAWYVISNGIIYSRTYDWQARRYTGSNPHFTHIHISIRYDEYAEFNRDRWIVVNKPRVKPGKVNLDNVREQFLLVANGHQATKDLTGVSRIQVALNRQYKAGLKADGIVGPKTLEAWRKHEKARGGKGRPGVPDAFSMKELDEMTKVITGVERSK